MVDSKVSESGVGEADLYTHDKQLPVAVKKTPLRDLQNENNITNQRSTGNPLFLKEDGAATEDLKISGIKRLPAESSVSHSYHQSSSINSPNSHLVYVRRKIETELGRNSTNETTGHKSDCSQPRQLDNQEDATQQQPQMKESRIQCAPAFAPFPTGSLATFPSSKPSVLSLGKSNNRAGTQETRGHPVTVAVPSSDQRRMNKRNWEERYLQLQVYLRKLDQSSQEDYLQMLRCLSSVELSRHAVDLEKRAIQLSVDEAKELQRVRALNVLGKSIRNSEGPPSQPGLPQN